MTARAVSSIAGPGLGAAAAGLPEGIVHAADCLEGLSRMAAASVDLVFADLPYGGTRNAWDVPLRLDLLWPALRRVCKPEAPMVFTATMRFAAELVARNPRCFRFDMVWHKNKATGFLNAKRQPLRAHELVLVFSERPPLYAPPFTQGHAPAHAIKGRPSRSSNYGAMPALRTYGGSTSRYPRSVLEIPVLNNRDPEHMHATQKPEALPAWFIRAFTKPGDLVLDPTAGSGSTLLAAKSLGRRFVGFEKGAEMAAKANERLARRPWPQQAADAPPQADPGASP